MKNVKKIAQMLISEAQKENIYTIIRLQDYKSRSINAKNGKIDNANLTESTGIGIQAYTQNGHTGFASVDTILDEKRLLACLHSAINSAKTSKQSNFEKIKEIFEIEPTKAEVFQKPEIDPFTITNKEMEKDLLKFHSNIQRKYPQYALSNTASFSTNDWRIFRSDGTDVHFSTSAAILVSTVNTSGKEAGNEFYESSYGKGYELVYDSEEKSAHIKRLANKLQYSDKLEAANHVSGSNRAILLDSSMAGVFVHEAFGHTAESDNIYQDSPLLLNKKLDKGKVVAKPFIHILDYADKNDRGFNPYSSYGIKRNKITIVKKGKLNSLISDIVTAKRAGCQLEGGAVCETYEDIPVPRMSCTQIILDKNKTIPLSFDHREANTKEIQKVLREAGVFDSFSEIIYLLGSSGGNVDSQKGNFQFAATLAFKMTKSIVELIKPVSFSGVTLEALHSVEMAFGDPIGIPGLCGKFGQYIPESTKAPMILLSPNKYVTIG
ncbi:MAG: TldD/PmbA family protein [Patescibacteria group bacterium]|nr:TldD/PmbA family protein [Patescibacteria group bacterium]